MQVPLLSLKVFPPPHINFNSFHKSTKISFFKQQHCSNDFQKSRCICQSCCNSFCMKLHMQIDNQNIWQYWREMVRAIIHWYAWKNYLWNRRGNISWSVTCMFKVDRLQTWWDLWRSICMLIFYLGVYAVHMDLW